jgi:isoquinoline 1-oxidoreductase alpha subunit
MYVMPNFSLNVNNKQYNIEAESDMPLLWVLRDILNLTGTKYGCGVASCGACTVMMDGNAVYACQRPIGSCVNKKIITIEGLSDDGSHPVQKAWLKAGVPQCGYCQPGQMMAAAAMLLKNKKPSEEMIGNVMSENLCRCGTYHRIKKAIHLAIDEMNK